jgi:hypothetical protein
MTSNDGKNPQELISLEPDRLAKISKSVRDTDAEFIKTCKTARDGLKNAAELVTGAIKTLKNVKVDPLVAKDSDEDSDDEKVVTGIGDVADLTSSLVKTLGDITKQYFALNYTPTGEISMAQIAKAGKKPETPAGKGIGEVGGVVDEIDPDDIED